MAAEGGLSQRGLVLAGDIGGTKTYLGVFSVEGGVLKPVREKGFVNASYNGLEDILSGFLSPDEAVEAACFGIACTVEGNRGVMTNLDWTVDGDAVASRFGFKRATLINDLVATAWGVGLLGKDDLAVLQEGEPREGNAAVIAAGTGLGEAIIFWDGLRRIPSGSEGGHADFAPRSALQAELLDSLSRTYGHVSYERVLSGPGLEAIYSFLREKRGDVEPGHLNERFASEGRAPVIADEGVNRGDAVCVEALGVFVSVYGAEAANLALKSMPFSGLYVGGGIAPKILKALKDGRFIESFRDKGRFSGLLSRMPVYVILNDRAALLGAAHCAASGLAQDRGAQ